jgi:glycosidase
MEDSKWWQTGVVYQIYPRSFQDANADGCDSTLWGVGCRFGNEGVDRWRR